MSVSLVRVRLLVAVLSGAAFLLLGRLAWVQLSQHQRYLEEAERQQETLVPVESPRGSVRTRDGLLLAGSVDKVAVYANPRRLPRAQWAEAAQALSPLLGLPAQRILQELASHQGFFYLAKGLDPEVAKAVARLSYRGVGALPSPQRVYPLGTLAAAVVGFVSAEGKGQAGVEAACNQLLAGEPALVRLARDGKKVPTRLLPQVEKPGREGFHLVLTLDARVQWVLEEELQRTLSHVGAKAAAAVALDPQTGEIWGMASLPSFDPQRLAAYPKENWQNRAVHAALEPGSSFKPFVVAAALLAGVVTPDSLVDCSGGGVQVAGLYFRDHDRYGLLPLRQVLAFSSNAGTIRLALRTPAAKLDEVIASFGFGQPTGVELPAESAGIYRRWGNGWSAATPAGLALGQEVSATALQLARAYAALANGGLLVRPTLIAEVRDRDGRKVAGTSRSPGERVLPQPLAQTVAGLLEAVVEEGTGQAAAVGGFRVAGKTGTAQKAKNGSYQEGHHAAWFAGFFPIPSPKLVVVVCVDEPATAFWAAEVAAPTFGRIAQRLVQLFRWAPQKEGWA